MKTKIAQIFAAFILLLTIPCKTFAQAPVCAIAYSYDAAGNRIKREYKCETPPNPNDPQPWNSNSTILTSLSPNPTTGVLTGVFSSPAGWASVTVTSMAGGIILQTTYTQTLSSFTINIAQAVPANYIVTVSAFNTTESYVIVKL